MFLTYLSKSSGGISCSYGCLWLFLGRQRCCLLLLNVAVRRTKYRINTQPTITCSSWWTCQNFEVYHYIPSMATCRNRRLTVIISKPQHHPWCNIIQGITSSTNTTISSVWCWNAKKVSLGFNLSLFFVTGPILYGTTAVSSELNNNTTVCGGGASSMDPPTHRERSAQGGCEASALRLVRRKNKSSEEKMIKILWARWGCTVQPHPQHDISRTWPTIV